MVSSRGSLNEVTTAQKRLVDIENLCMVWNKILMLGLVDSMKQSKNLDWGRVIVITQYFITKPEETIILLMMHVDNIVITRSDNANIL